MHYELPLGLLEVVSPFIQIFRWNTNNDGRILDQRNFILYTLPVVLTKHTKNQEVQGHRNRTFYKQAVCRL